jgi:hypothetical protein
MTSDQLYIKLIQRSTLAAVTNEAPIADSFVNWQLNALKRNEYQVFADRVKHTLNASCVFQTANELCIRAKIWAKHAVRIILEMN